jgi:hypothetical protein
MMMMMIHFYATMTFPISVYSPPFSLSLSLSLSLSRTPLRMSRSDGKRFNVVLLAQLSINDAFAH